MRIYVAGGLSFSSDGMTGAGLRRRLLSFAERSVPAFSRWMEIDGLDIFLDSGAFSVWSGRAKVGLLEYCEFVAEHSPRLSAYASLDVIHDWHATAKNLDAMLEAGLCPLPVFHRNSPWSELDRLARDHKYIALGGFAEASGILGPVVIPPYLDAAWSILEKHWPIRVHGFGLASQWILERYPFYSADSTSATRGAGLGKVMRFRNGRLSRDTWQDYVRTTLDGSVLDPDCRTARTGPAGQARCENSIRAVLAAERYLTDLWAYRWMPLRSRKE